MTNSWTGGQYSVFRILLGGYLFVHFLQLLPWSEELFSSTGMLARGSDSPILHLFPNILALIDSPHFVMGFVASAGISSIFLILGYKDRLAALWMWYVLACLFGRNPLIANPSLPYVGWMLLAHLFIPSAPYGSLEARGRINPSGNWKMPKLIFTAAWIILAITYSYSGYTKLLSPSWVEGENINYVINNPLARDYFLRDFFLWFPPIFLKILTWTVLYVELLFAPLSLSSRLRPILWFAMLLIQFGFAFLLNFFDLTAAMLLFHMLTFDPAWLGQKDQKDKEILFYDGDCGLCHRVIRFLLAEDSKKVFQFSPLKGSRFQELFSQEQRLKFPDSIVLVTDSGQTRTRSSAVVYLLSRLGGLWCILGAILWLMPVFIRDAGYNFVGKIRLNLFKSPSSSCPIVSENLRDRFL
jgi:predicted DCC family thiol-disulfide oxidoreductase YuxK